MSSILLLEVQMVLNGFYMVSFKLPNYRLLFWRQFRGQKISAVNSCWYRLKKILLLKLDSIGL